MSSSLSQHTLLWRHPTHCTHALSLKSIEVERERGREGEREREGGREGERGGGGEGVGEAVIFKQQQVN